MKTLAGFTLLEVMIAIAILALALATVFGSNIGGARSTAHARALTNATLMARCRMTEAEAYLLKNQLPATEQTLEDPPETGADPCCTRGVTCDARVELIELPTPTDVGTAAGSALLGRAANAAQGSQFTRTPSGVGPTSGDGGVGALGSLASAMGMLGAGGAGGGGTGGGSLAGSGAPNTREMATALMGTVYPAIKPLLEGAIRKLTVTVRWREGSREHSFQVVEYVTNPGQTLPSGDALNALGQALGGPGNTPGGGPNAPGSTPPANVPPPLLPPGRLP